MAPTIKNIAELAGVSVGTVDRVLHGRPKVSPEKRKRVEEAIRKLDYKPNPAARSLALHGQNISVALIHPFWVPFLESELERGMAAAQAEISHYGITVKRYGCKTDDIDETLQAIDNFVKEGVKGLAVSAKNTRAMHHKLQHLTEKGFPIVTFNSDIPDCGSLCYVGQNEVKSGRIAGDLMAKLVSRDAKVLIGCGSLGFLGLKSRVIGFNQRFAELGLPKQHLVVETKSNYDITYAKVLEQLEKDRSISALYMSSENVRGAVDAVKKVNGLGQIKIVCHDLSDVNAQFLRDGIVEFVVDQNIYYQGYQPALVLARYLMGGVRPESDKDYTAIRVMTSELL